RDAARGAALTQSVIEPGHDAGVFGKAADDLETRILGAMTELDQAALEAPLFERPHRPLPTIKAMDRGRRHQQRVVEVGHRDPELHLLAEIDAGRRVVTS